MKQLIKESGVTNPAQGSHLYTLTYFRARTKYLENHLYKYAPSMHHHFCTHGQNEP